MEESDEAGRFLVATRDIRKGEVHNIFKESAIIKIKINININTRAVESESLKVGKSLTRSSSACHVGPLALERVIIFASIIVL